MSDQAQKATEFLSLHRPGEPLLIPNPWDAGSAKLLVSLGYRALATTSSGYAATLGRLDGTVTREEAIAHSAEIVAATEVPVSADLENAFADDPGGVAQTISSRSRPDSPAARSRITADATTRSTTLDWPRSECGPRSRSLTPAQCSS